MLKSAKTPCGSVANSGLADSTTYEVQVRATNAEGTGSWSDSGEGTTLTSNHPPVFALSSVTRSVTENTAAGTIVGAVVTAIDIDNDTLTYTLSGTGAGSFAIDAATGQITVGDSVTLNYEATSQYTVTVEASDGELADTATVTILVTDVDEAPERMGRPTVAQGGAGELAVSWSVPANAGPPIAYYKVRYREKGVGAAWTKDSLGVVTSATISGLADSTTYRVQVRAANAEGQGSWSTSGEGTTVTPNRAPAFAASSVTRSVDENVATGTNVGLPVTATDADNDTLTYTLSGTGAGSFAIDAATGQITVGDSVTLNHEATSQYTVTVEASDGELADTATVTITVTDVDEAPGRPSAPTVTGGIGSVSVAWSAPPNEGPPITYYKVRYREKGVGAAWSKDSVGVVTSATISGLADSTTYRVQVRAANAEGQGSWSSSGEGTTLTPNQAPVFAASSVTRSVDENVAAGANVGLPVTATDGDNDALSYALSGTGAGSFAIDPATGQITVGDSVTLNYESGDTLYTVTVEASDGELADTATVTITVSDVAEAPGKPAAPGVTGALAALHVVWSAPLNTGPSITGYDLRYRTTGAGDWATKSFGVVTSDTISGLADSTTYEVQLRATNAEGTGSWSDSGEGTTLTPNHAPVFAASSVTRTVAENTAAGTNVGAAVTATDADNDTLTYTLAGTGAGSFAIDAATGQITVGDSVTLNHEATSQYTVTVEASDGELADTATVTITVTDVDNEAPGEPSAPTVTGGTGSVSVAWSAPANAGPPITYYKVRYREKGVGAAWTKDSLGVVTSATISGLADSTTYRVQVRAANAEGQGSWSSSGEGTTLTPNQAPVFAASSVTRSVDENVATGTNVGLPVTATDGDNDALSYALSGTGAGSFAIDAATGQITVGDSVTLNHEATSQYTVTVEASDGTLADTATVTITVSDVAEAPGKPAAPGVTGALAALHVVWSAPLNTGPSITGYDLRYRTTGAGDWATKSFGVVTSDTISGLADSTTYEVQLRATNAEGTGSWSDSGEGTTLTSNEAPAFAASSETRTVAENTAAGTTVGAAVTATDADNDTLTYTLAGTGAGSFAIDAATGQITVGDSVTLNHEATSQYTVTVEASDGELADTATVTITVTDVDNEAPGEPSAPTVTGGTGSVSVAWSAPANAGPPITYYKVRYREKGVGAAWTKDSLGVVTSATISGLADSTTYRVQVRAANAEGQGSWSSSGEGTTGAPNQAPVFAASSVTRAVDENAEAGTNVGAAVTATDGDNDTLTYALSGTDAATFAIDAATGQITVGDSVTLDYESGDTLYTVTVEASDGTLADTATVTITVTDLEGSGTDTVGDDLLPLTVEYDEASYVALAGGEGADVTVRLAPAADREVVVPLTLRGVDGAAMEYASLGVPVSLRFERGDSVRTFAVEAAHDVPSGKITLGFGELPDSVRAGGVSDVVVEFVNTGADAGRFEQSLDVGLAVFGRAVAEGAHQAIGGRIDAAMRDDPRGAGGGGSPQASSGWTARALSGLSALTGAPLNGHGQAPGSLKLPTMQEGVERLLPRVSFSTALGGQHSETGPRFSVWGEGSVQGFRGKPGGVDYDGGMRALTVGADARLGNSGLVGVSLMRSGADLDYANQSVKGTLNHTFNTVHPYLYFQPSPKVGIWAMAGFGSGTVEAEDAETTRALDATLGMVSGGVKVPLLKRGAFGLGIAGDAFGVRMRADGGTAEGEGAAARARALVEASYAAGGLKVGAQAGGRYDAGDADAGAGAEAGATLGYAGRGVDFEIRSRMAFGSDGHEEWGLGLRLAWDPGAAGEGFRLAVSPGRGSDQSGVRQLMDHGRFTGGTGIAQHEAGRFDAEAGYGLKSFGDGSLDAYSRLSVGGTGRAWTLGAGYDLERALKLSIEGVRNESLAGPARQGLNLKLNFIF